ncbi:outer membrane protein assembly factor BamB family protein [Halorussus ruber]|uniref:outer membrane protein assembly factor BamB family protein n=1 Tax=Halorussus ruber TaxID=1126238 RepID=UPI0010932F9D|nr:PQQ-binding-like beta-propeller repeat protein [Halorussus ruber]
MSPKETATTRRGFLVATGATVLAGCSGSPPNTDATTTESVSTTTTALSSIGPDDWPQLGRTAAHNGYAPAASSDAEPAVATETSVEGSLTTPTVVGDTVYVTRGAPTPDGPQATLEAYGLASGERRWSRSLGVEFRYNAPFSNHRPIVHGDRVYAATNDGVVAANRATGDVEWRTEDVAVGSPPSVTDERVYVTADETLVALNHEGTERWRTTAEGQRAKFQLTAVSDGTVFADVDGRLMALDSASGDVRWEHAPEDGLSSATPAVADDAVVRASFDGVEAVSTDGTREWLADAPEEALLRPVVGHGTVFTLGLYGTVTAYDLSSGERAWQSSVGDGEWTQETAPILLDDALVVGQSNGDEVSVHALAPDSGETRWRVSASATRVRGPVAASGHLVVTTQDRHPNQEGESPIGATIRAYEL